MVWYGRRQWAGMVVAVSPDIVDYLPNKPHGDWMPIHRFFWSERWLQPEWAFAWMALAILCLALILREGRK